MKKHVFFLAVIFFWISNTGKAQVFSQINYSPYTIAPEDVVVALSPDGAMFRADVIDVTASFGQDVVRLKHFDNSGNELYSIDIGGYADHVALKADQSRVYINLALYSVQNYPVTLPEIGVVETGGFQHGTLVLALNHELGVEWYHFYGANSNSGFWDNAIALLPEGNVLFNMFETAAGMSLQSVIREFDFEGNQIMSMYQTALVHSIEVGTDGSLYLTGPCATAQVDFNGTVVDLSSDYNFYIVKYNSEGLYQWSNYVEEVTCSNPDIFINDEGVYLAVSLLTGDYLFGNLTMEIASVIHYVISKLDKTDGTFQWVKTVTQSNTSGKSMSNYNNAFLTGDRNGRLFLTGNVYEDIIWNNGMEANYTKNSPFVLEMNAEGVVQWVNVVARMNLYARALHVDYALDGSLAISGLASNFIQFDTVQVAQNGYFGYAARMQLDALTSAPEQNREFFTRVTPNPGSGVFRFELHDDIPSGAVLRVFDLSGREVKHDELVGVKIHTIDISPFKAGIYTWKLTNSGFVSTGKLVKNK